MEKGFSNGQDWWTTTAAMAVWAAHFTLLWVASVVFPGHPAARWLALAFTLAAVASLAWLWHRAGRPRLKSTPGLGLAIAIGGTLFNAVPALVG
jgi:drug/metabolite transporter (DMT)-like permease